MHFLNKGTTLGQLQIGRRGLSIPPAESNTPASSKGGKGYNTDFLESETEKSWDTPKIEMKGAEGNVPTEGFWECVAERGSRLRTGQEKNVRVIGGG